MSDDEIVHDWESDCYVLHIANTNLREERDRLRAENEKLRTALKPFVTAPPSDAKPDDYDWLMVRPEDIRAAAAALKETGDD